MGVPVYLGSSPSPAEALRQLRQSRYASAFLANDPFAAFWLQDLRHHTALALIMARASAAATPGALTRRGLSDLAGMSMSGVHTLLNEACARGDFSRDADAGDRRRVMLLPSAAVTAHFRGLVGNFLQAALGEGGPASDPGPVAEEPQVLAIYARFACALIGARRPGGRLWLEPSSLAMLSDLLAAGGKGISQDGLKTAAARRGYRATVDGDLAFAAMAGLAESGPRGRVRLSAEGQACMQDHVEIWRFWSSEIRVALAQLQRPMATVAA